MPPFNWIAILIAAIIPMLLGFIYYHKSLFGKAWMDSLGLTDDDLNKGNMGLIFGVSLVMAALIAMFMTGNVNGPGQEGEFDTFKHGVLHGMIVSLFLIIPVMVTNGLFERKSWKNLLINAGYWLICLALIGGVVDAMNHWPNEMTV